MSAGESAGHAPSHTHLWLRLAAWRAAAARLAQLGDESYNQDNDHAEGQMLREPAQWQALLQDMLSAPFSMLRCAPALDEVRLPVRKHLKESVAS